MMRQLYLKIYGHVTNVNFRYTTHQLAKQLDLVGWVKNCPDQTVEILAQGAEESLKQLLEWSQHGPQYAQVDKVKFEWQEPKNKFTDFHVEY